MALALAALPKLRCSATAHNITQVAQVEMMNAHVWRLSAQYLSVMLIKFMEVCLVDIEPPVQAISSYSLYLLIKSFISDFSYL